ncbi:PREDICTED: glycerophosphodiester phosphodiesterase 1 [Rhagoletis zephyria]|uniref:glycerophosphodiester phosphodiesterase 1 n=1 Tax=Rhagoletis zephyria TaxID=28612 RepID=UPI0008115372|nr:PREDICTED: glycerophosphodiester phosphodiesterase 1 [Rhagoletis zephyria]XP_017476551.1 PREDICTED: glycerophosphodiester phosphodiesterase 1 [Rhagoletis zephyria]XP_017476552.1 PREDICTED: glycerophosphodiester phosphodiesterase 1 [Rhagoletis zephyria]
MRILNVLWILLKMLYQLLWCLARLLSVLFNVFWFACNLASACIPWLTLVLLVACVASKFAKLRSPNEKRLFSLLGGCAPEELTYWPIANRGAGYDAPENSRAAIKKCAARGYRNVLLEAGLTADGEIVIVNRPTLERGGLMGGTARYTLEELRKLNITELHPLGSQFEAEQILTLAQLMQFLEEQQRITVFLHILDNNVRMLERLKAAIEANAQFTSRMILISRSPYAIYQLRKLYPELICGLWTEKSLSLAILKASTLITSIYGALFRNIIAPVIGISVVFVNKEEFNLHIAELWRNVGVRPLVYNVNSPNEKRYFQKTMKTQYLTDSLRSEPHLLMKA